MKFIDDAIKESEKRMEKKKPEKKVSSDIDDGLVDIIEGNKTKIFVVGAGGAGNNTISRLNEMGIEGATTITVNTDAQDLFYSQSSKKILLGRQTCGGLGAGGEPSIGEECAEESEDEIREELDGADMVFVTCGLGGGTGTGSAPIISKLSKKTGMKLYRFCTRLDQIFRNGKSLVMPEILEFITLVDNAKFVLTDSFHATAFSINLNTEPICIYPNNYSGRLSSFLELVESTQRHVRDYDDFDIINRNTDFAKVNKILNKEREKVDDFLSKIVKENGGNNGK